MDRFDYLGRKNGVEMKNGGGEFENAQQCKNTVLNENQSKFNTNNTKKNYICDCIPCI
jgi:hypothetical protein